MNKKLLIFGILGILTLSLVAAGILVYQGQFKDNFNVESPILVDGLVETDLGIVNGGETLKGSHFNLENVADFGVLVGLLNDAETGIDVSYKSELELTKKDVDFSLDVWNIPEDSEKVQVEYTVIANGFSVEVTDNSKDGYVLIYYADNDDRFANPGQAVLIENVAGDLPAVNDENVALNDYSLEYPTTPHGAKIWYVPSDALNEGVIDWTRASEFYFESKLIQFDTEGEITMYPGMSLEIIPEYSLDLSFNGETSVTNSIQNIELA